MQMDEILTLQIYQHADLKALLQSTANKEIRYLDDRDLFWGYSSTNERSKNNFGKCLERVRARMFPR